MFSYTIKKTVEPLFFLEFCCQYRMTRNLIPGFKHYIMEFV